MTVAATLNRGRFFGGQIREQGLVNRSHDLSLQMICDTKT